MLDGVATADRDDDGIALMAVEGGGKNDGGEDVPSSVELIGLLYISV